jgi:hypothetical protein
MITKPFYIQLILLLLLQVNINGQEPKTASVRQENGRSVLIVNDKQVTPAFYSLTHAYGARWSWEEVPRRNLKNFCDIGFRLFQLDLYFEDIWYKGCDTLDIGKARRQVRGLLEVCPDAGVVIRIHVNAPFWWNEENKEECTQYADGPVDIRTYGPPFNNEDGDVDRPLRASLASMKWRKESGEKLAEFCRAMANTPEGKSVIGIHVSGGVYGEWHYWGFIDHDPDTGPAMTQYFRNWLRKKYISDEAMQKTWNSIKYTLDNAIVPDLSERNFTSDGNFRDPSLEQRVIDYFMAQQEVVAEDIEYFTAIVKKSWPRQLIVGVFYGYFHMTFCRQAAGGHLLVERILNCPSIDYLSAPQSYWGAAQLAGGSGNSRGVIESALLHGKLWLDEMDNGGLQKKTALDPVRNSGKYDPEYLPVLQRSAIYPLMRGIGLWYYDFGPRESFGWWDNTVYMNSIRKEKELFDSLQNRLYEPVSDVLYVWDQESFLYVANGWTPICYDLIDQSFEEALRTGSAGDQIYLFDLDKVDLKKYRAVLFMNVYKLSEKQRDFIKTKVARDGRTLIWNYLPGYTDGKSISLKFVNDVTQFETIPLISKEIPVVQIENTSNEYTFEGAINPMVVISDPKAEILARLKNSGHPVVARKTFNNFRSVFSSLPLHNTDLFRKLFKEAGCHIYNQENDFTYANSGLIMIHTKDGGRRTIHLKNGKNISVEIPAYSTWLINAETGNILLK